MNQALYDEALIRNATECPMLILHSAALQGGVTLIINLLIKVFVSELVRRDDNVIWSHPFTHVVNH